MRKNVLIIMVLLGGIAACAPAMPALPTETPIPTLIATRRPTAIPSATPKPTVTPGLRLWSPRMKRELLACSSPILSAPEAANCGQHIYSFQATVVAGDCRFVVNGRSSTQAEGIRTQTHKFLSDGTATIYLDEDFEPVNAHKIATDTFTYSWDQQDYTLVYNLDGYEIRRTGFRCRMDVVYAVVP